MNNLCFHLDPRDVDHLRHWIDIASSFEFHRLAIICPERVTIDFALDYADIVTGISLQLEIIESFDRFAMRFADERIVVVSDTHFQKLKIPGSVRDPGWFYIAHDTISIPPHLDQLLIPHPPGNMFSDLQLANIACWVALNATT